MPICAKCIGLSKNQSVKPGNRTTEKMEDHIYIYMHRHIKQFKQSESYYIQVKLDTRITKIQEFQRR